MPTTYKVTDELPRHAHCVQRT